ncbi:MAG: hypothetical protein MZV63_37245 [Marinilabiliales bacterium]|nr:hypothetical protein [Marinilabiliales bacterium]
MPRSFLLLTTIPHGYTNYPDHDPTDFESACMKAKEWDYNSDARIALGTFFTRSLANV